MENDDSCCGITETIYVEKSKSIRRFFNLWDCHFSKMCEVFLNVISFSEIASH